MKKFIIKIFDIYYIPDKGVVLAGINSKFDPMTKEEVIEYIGDEIIVTNNNKSQLTVDVLGVEMASSIVDKKNIYILIPSEYNSVAMGSSVYKE